MNRREFIKSLLAVGASITLPIDIALASDLEFNQALKDWTYEFEVQDYGAIWVADYSEPSTRAEAYCTYIEDLKTVDSLSQFAERTPLVTRLRWRYEDYRAALAEGHRQLPDDPDYGWQYWLDQEPDLALPIFLEEAEKWLDEEPDSADWDYLPVTVGAQGVAYQYFACDEDEEVLDKLGIVIIDGDCPGSSYFAAELRIPIEEANRIAVREGLPYRFKAA